MRAILVTSLLSFASCATETPPIESSPATIFAVGRQDFRGASGDLDALLVGKTLYISGLQSDDTSAGVDAQTGVVMKRLGAILEQANLSYSNVVSCHVHLSDMDNYADMNAVYGSVFEPGRYPARTTLEFPRLPGDAGVVVTCTAYADAAEIEIIRPSEDVIPPAMGPYSSAVRAGDTVYLSGQGGRDPATGELSESTAGQAAKTLETIGHILAAAELSYSNTVFAASYTPVPADHDDVDRAFAEHFMAGGAPARSRIGLSRLPGDISTEITFVAARDNYINRLFMHDEKPTDLLSPSSLTGDTLFASAVSARAAGFDAQADAVLAKHEEMLALGSMNLSHVVSVRAYLSRVDDAALLRDRLVAKFPEALPPLTIVEARNPPGIELQMELIAVR